MDSSESQSIKKLPRQSAELLAEILDDFQGGIFALNKDWNFIYLNKRAASIVSLKPNDIVGKNLWETFPQVKGTLIEENYRYAMQNKQVRNFQTKGNGAELFFDITIYPFENGILVYWRDITENKKNEKALRESDERMRAIAESSVVGISVSRLSDGVILFTNAAYDKTFGFKRGGLVGYHAPNLYANPKDREKLLETLKKQGFVKDYAVKVKRKDGTSFWVATSISPVHFGGEQALLGISIDISERKQTEEALRQAQVKLQEYAMNLESLVEERTQKIKQSEQSYRELYESFGEAFIATDWEFNVIHWNKAAERVTTVPAKEALGKKIYDVLPEMTSVDINPYFEALKEKRPARFMMNTVSRETKRPSVFEISTYPSAQGIIIIVEDKTEEEETKRLSAIGQTAGMVGHDIRNPLQAMISDVYLLKDELTAMPECKTKEGIAESIDSIEQNIAYINKIVADLQDFARPLKPEMIEVTDLCSVMDNFVKSIDVPSNIAVARTCSVQKLKLKLDLTFLKRILTNLITNAIQAMPHGGKLSIDTFERESKLRIIVEDTGVGIPEDVKPRVFTPMTTTKAKGQGFGLAVVKRLVETLNGTINFESQEGRGTKFTVELPF